MGKNKIIGLVIWLITLIGPMKSWMFNDFGTGLMYLVMFLGTVIGVFCWKLLLFKVYRFKGGLIWFILID